MFTGIIEEIGTIRSIQRQSKSAVLTIGARKVLEDTKVGDSIAVNGVCLTVTSLLNGAFTVDVMAETLRRSSLGSMQYGSSVNLERAMPANGRFGGHFVAGHIDGTGRILSFRREEQAVWVEIAAERKILRYIVEKGSIVIDGISLTVAKLASDRFAVSVIPHTGQETTLLEKRVGDLVNLENDPVGKYVERFMLLPADGVKEMDAKSDGAKDMNGKPTGELDADAPSKASSGITMEFLQQHGFGGRL